MAVIIGSYLYTYVHIKTHVQIIFLPLDILVADYQDAHPYKRVRFTTNGTEWTSVPPMNNPRRHPTMFATLRAGAICIYAFGGSYARCKPYDSCEYIIIGDDKWITIKDSKMTVDRHFGRAVLLNDDTVIICGGCDSTCEACDEPSAMPDCDAFNLITHTFSPFPRMLKAREYCAAVKYRDTIVVIGGMQGYGYIAECEQYIPEHGEWHEFPEIKHTGCMVTAAVLDDTIYILHGDLEMYDGATWIYVTTWINEDVNFLVAFERRLVVFSSCEGEADGQGYEYDVDTDRWSRFLVEDGAWYFDAISF